MAHKIKISEKESLRKILYKNKGAGTFFDQIFKRQNIVLPSEKFTVPYNSTGENSFRNYYNDNGAVTKEGITAIFCHFLSDYHYKETKEYFGYNITELQEFFKRLDKQDIKEITYLINDFNKLIDELTKDNPEFNGIKLNEEWEIVIENLKSDKIPSSFPPSETPKMDNEDEEDDTDDGERDEDHEKDGGETPPKIEDKIEQIPEKINILRVLFSRQMFFLRKNYFSVLAMVAGLGGVLFIIFPNRINTTINDSKSNTPYFVDEFGDTNTFSRTLCLLSKWENWDSIQILANKYENDTAFTDLVLYYKGLSIIKDSNNVEIGKDPSFYFFQINPESESFIFALNELVNFYGKKYKDSEEEFNKATNDLLNFLKFKGLVETPIYYITKYYIYIIHNNINYSAYSYFDVINDMANDDRSIVKKIKNIENRFLNSKTVLNFEDSITFSEYKYVQYLYKDSYYSFAESGAYRDYNLSLKDSLEYHNYLIYFASKTPYEVIEKGANSLGLCSPEFQW